MVKQDCFIVTVNSNCESNFVHHHINDEQFIEYWTKLNVKVKSRFNCQPELKLNWKGLTTYFEAFNIKQPFTGKS